MAAFGRLFVKFVQVHPTHLTPPGRIMVSERAKFAKLDAESLRRQAEIATVKASIAKLEAALPMAQSREADYTKLVDQGFISGHATQDKTRERIEMERDLVTQRARLAETLAIATETEQIRIAYRAETQRLLNDRCNDTLTGDANANWLVGGQRSDTFNASAGDDMLIIDTQNQRQNIHAYGDLAMVQVVSSEGVTLNLAQSVVEVAVGGTGDDVFIGGGRSCVFIRVGGGNDIVTGGRTDGTAANEADRKVAA